MLSDFDITETLHKVIIESEELHGIKSECDESSPEITIKLLDGQVFNITVKKVK